LRIDAVLCCLFRRQLERAKTLERLADAQGATILLRLGDVIVIVLARIVAATTLVDNALLVSVEWTVGRIVRTSSKRDMRAGAVRVAVALQINKAATVAVMEALSRLADDVVGIAPRILSSTIPENLTQAVSHAYVIATVVNDVNIAAWGVSVKIADGRKVRIAHGREFSIAATSLIGG